MKIGLQEASNWWVHPRVAGGVETPRVFACCRHDVTPQGPGGGGHSPNAVQELPREDTGGKTLRLVPGDPGIRCRVRVLKTIRQW